jgi:hypothetical protein
MRTHCQPVRPGPGLAWPRVIRVGDPYREMPEEAGEPRCESIKVHADQSVMSLGGSPDPKYSPRVPVSTTSTLLESWPIPPLTCVGRWIKTKQNGAAAVKALPLQTSV